MSSHKKLQHICILMLNSLDWKLVINDIRDETQDKVDEENLAGVLHVNNKMKNGMMISSLAKLIRERIARKP